MRAGALTQSSSQAVHLLRREWTWLDTCSGRPADVGVGVGRHWRLEFGAIIPPRPCECAFPRRVFRMNFFKTATGRVWTRGVRV